MSDVATDLLGELREQIDANYQRQAETQKRLAEEYLADLMAERRWFPKHTYGSDNLSRAYTEQVWRLYEQAMGREPHPFAPGTATTDQFTLFNILRDRLGEWVTYADLMDEYKRITHTSYKVQITSYAVFGSDHGGDNDFTRFRNTPFRLEAGKVGTKKAYRLVRREVNDASA